MTRSKRLYPVSLVVPALLFGCSEAVPPAAESGWEVFITTGAHTQSCNLVSPEAIRMGDVTDQHHDALEKHSLNSAQIYCSVVSNGGSFTVEGFASNGRASLQLSIPNIDANATEANPAAGRLSVAGPPTALEVLKSPEGEPCNFYFSNGGQSSQLAAGRIWLTASCPTVGDPSIGRQCAVREAHAAFQNCEQ